MVIDKKNDLKSQLYLFNGWGYPVVSKGDEEHQKNKDEEENKGVFDDKLKKKDKVPSS